MGLRKREMRLSSSLIWQRPIATALSVRSEDLA